MERVEIAVELTVDDKAIIRRLARRAHFNKKEMASFMRSAVAVRAQRVGIPMRNMRDLDRL